MNEKSFIYWNGKLAILYIRTYLELEHAFTPFWLALRHGSRSSQKFMLAFV